MSNKKGWGEYINEKGLALTNNDKGLISELKNINFDASGITSALLDDILGLIGNRLQMNYQKELMNEQHRLNQIASENAFALSEQGMQNQHNRNLQMYNLTQSTQAKVNELEQAGLSVGLLQGTPSQGGASTAGGATAQAGSTGLGSAPQVNLALDIASKQAQIELMKAQAKKTNEEAKGQSVENEVNIKWLDKTAEETYKKLQADVTGQETANKLADLQLYINDMTAESSIQQLTAQAVEASNQANISGINYDIASETKEISIKMATAGYEKLIADIANTKENTALQRKQIQKMSFDMKLAYQQFLWEVYDIQMEAWDKKMDHYDARMERKLKEAITRYNGRLQWNINERNIEADFKQLFIQEGSDMFQAFIKPL